MNGINLTDELLSELQLQKEYIGLQLKEKLVRLTILIALTLVFVITLTTLAFYCGGTLAAISFIIIFLCVVSLVAYLHQRSITRSRKHLETRIHTSQTSLRNHINQLTTPPDTWMHLYQTIHFIVDITHELKKLFKDKE